MPGLGYYGTTEEPASTRRTRFKRQFKNSPLHDESYNNKALVEIANQKMLEHDESDPNLDFNYTQAPSWLDVKKITNIVKGRYGYPTTPWTPNQASPGEIPGEVNVDPYNIPSYDLDSANINDDFVINTDGTVDPSITSAEISSTRLGDILTLGKRPTKNT